MRTINIAASYSSKYAGNFIPSLFAIGNKLKEANYNVIFSFPEAAKSRFWVQYLIGHNFKVCFFNTDSNLQIIKSLKKINRVNNVTLLYSHFISTPIIKMLSPFSRKLKLVLHIHSDFRCGKNALSFNGKIKKILFDKCIRRDASFIYVSESMMREDSNKNSSYVKNALSVNRITSSESTSQLDKSSFDSHKFKFLVFGWAPETKGIDITCKAFLEMDEKIQRESQLFIVVDENGKGKCADFIEKTINTDLNKYPNIVLLNPQEDVFELYKRCDVFISSSRSEGFSYSILEALYFGLVVLASNIEGTKWAHQYGTQLFNLDKPDELKDLMEQQVLKHAIKKKNQAELLDIFSISNWTNIICDIIEGSF